MGPTLSEVLTTGGHSASYFNYVYLIALMVAAGAAVFSVVKGLESYRRGRLISAVVEDRPTLREIENRKKIEKLNFLVEELKSEKERLAKHNSQLAEQGKGFDLHKQKEEVLKKSNLVLARECERLKAEKEELVLKTAQPLIFDNQPTKPQEDMIEIQIQQEVAMFDKLQNKMPEETISLLKEQVNRLFDEDSSGKEAAAGTEKKAGKAAVRKIAKKAKNIKSLKKEVARKPKRVSKKKR